VFTVDKNKAVQKKLTVGYEDPSNVEALSGFEVGTAVIVLGQSGLKDGQLVRSVNPGTNVSATGSPGGESPGAKPEIPAGKAIPPAVVPAPAGESPVQPAKPNKS
jgi:hypothetical protein